MIHTDIQQALIRRLPLGGFDPVSTPKALNAMLAHQTFDGRLGSDAPLPGKCFQTRGMIAAEEVRRAGFSQTHSARLDGLRAARCSNELMFSSLSMSLPHDFLSSSAHLDDGSSPRDFTSS